MSVDSGPSRFLAKVRTKSISRLNSLKDSKRTSSSFSKHRKTSSSTISSSSYNSYSHTSYSSSLTIGTYVNSTSNLDAPLTPVTSVTTKSSDSNKPTNSTSSQISSPVSSVGSHMSMNSYNAFPDIDLWSPNSPTKASPDFPFSPTASDCNKSHAPDTDLEKNSTYDYDSCISLPPITTLSTNDYDIYRVAPRTRYSDIRYDRKFTINPPLPPAIQEGIEMNDLEGMTERNIFDDYQNSGGFSDGLIQASKDKHQTESGSYASYRSNKYASYERPARHTMYYFWPTQGDYYSSQHTNTTPMKTEQVTFDAQNLVKRCPSLQSFRSFDQQSCEDDDYDLFLDCDQGNQNSDCATGFQDIELTDELERFCDAVDLYPFLSSGGIDDAQKSEALYTTALSQDCVGIKAVTETGPEFGRRKRDQLLQSKKQLKCLRSVLFQKR